MNKIDVSTPSTTVLSQYPGYNSGDQYLTQIGTFTIWVDTTLSGTANIVLPPVAAFRLGSANFKIFDVAGNAGNGNPIVISFEDGALVNGSVSITLNTNYGNVQVQLQDGEWFANLNGTGGGGGGITGANNGLSVSGGTVVQLGSVVGAPLIQNSIVTGLQTYPLSFQSTDGTFYVAAGNLAAAPYNLAINSYAVSSTTAGTQALSLTLVQNGLLELLNVDSLASVARSIGVLSQSGGVSGFPNGGIQLQEVYLGAYKYAVQLLNESIILQIQNPTLTAPTQFPARIIMNNNQVLCYKYISNSDNTGISNGWDINAGTGGGGATDHAAIFWHGTMGGYGNNGSAALQLNSSGVSFNASANSGSAPVLVFSVSPTGQIFTSLPTYANDAAAGVGGLTTGDLYRCSTTTPANGIVAKV